MEPQIVKLTDTDAFDRIATGYRSTSGLTAFDMKQYSAWYNKYKDEIKKLKIKSKSVSKSNIMWVPRYIEIIFKDTQENDKYSVNTKRVHLESLARVLLAIDKVKFRDTAREFFQSTIAVQKELQESDTHLMKKTELDNYIPFKELMVIANDLFDDFMNLPNKVFKARKDISVAMKATVMCMNVYFPPLRMNLVDMEWWDKNIEPPENKTNYMWYIDGHYRIVINYDKIENKRQAKKAQKRDIFKVTEDTTKVYIKADKLKQLLDKLMYVIGGKYLLVSITEPTEPMSRTSYYDVIKNSVKSKFPGRIPRQNLLRKLYINQWHNYRDPKTNYKLLYQDLEYIAKIQRHTVTTAIKTYEKRDLDSQAEFNQTLNQIKGFGGEDSLSSIDFDEPIDIYDPPAIKKKKSIGPFNLHDWSKQYYTENKARIAERNKDKYATERDDILRKKIVRNLNNGTVKKPMTSTITKYELKQDSDGQWV
jgi:hypothetical protein